jgi:hypothetical protein
MMLRNLFQTEIGKNANPAEFPQNGAASLLVKKT